ncbi:MAG: 3-deoxy-7-phosphoheptulonate synthase class II [Oligoflexia bacterium]|nr:3-deoxy-7-phosphoheptulonate synthase class II [Oligoflexia bacterium]
MQPNWTPDSWRDRPAQQQADYQSPSDLRQAADTLRRLPPIVTSWEIEKLKLQLAEVAQGQRFLLQGGDCSERFADCQASLIDAKLKVLLMMSAVLTYGGGKRVARVGRIAGQYAKPRSSAVETINGVTLPSYRGDLVNGIAFTADARRPDPQRMIEAYSRSSMTLNFIRSLLSGGFGDIHHVDVWDLSFVEHAEQPHDYLRLVEGMKASVRFLDAAVGRRLSELADIDFYTSHEGLHLDYESAVTELPPLRQGWYDLGTHMPWIGDRTRALDGAHVEFFRGIRNPIGVKVGPTMDPVELVELISVLSPDNEPGRMTLICRLGADRVLDLLPPLVDAVQRAGKVVVWCSDPMHGNTYKTADGTKTRHFDQILAELDHSFEVHADAGTYLGGVHFEMTGQNVTEVVGGARGLTEADLGRCYDSDVDPRLNYEQALEMAFLIARRIGGER